MSTNVDLLRTNFRKGQQFTAKEANIITSTLKAVWKSLIKLGVVDSSGISTRTPNPKSAASLVRKAFVKTTPGATVTVECYLDTNDTGEVITVTCEVIGGTALNSVVPRLGTGIMIPVWDDSGTWRPFFPYQTSENCDCS